MKFGKILARVKLDRNPHVYSGSEDAISGQIELTFEPSPAKTPTSAANEFFGSLQVKVIFQGRLQTSMKEGTGGLSNAANRIGGRFTRNQTLFRTVHYLFHGPVELSNGESKEYPFKLFFPAHSDPLANGSLKNDGAQNEVKAETLPPTINCAFDFRNMRFYESDYGAHVNYSIEPQVTPKGIDIKIAYPGPYPIVLYEPPPSAVETLSRTTMFEHQVSVLIRDIAAEPGRSQGFKGMTKAFLDQAPRFAFDVLCTSVPGDIRPGQRFNFDVSVRKNVEHTTATVHPEIVLEHCEVSIVAYTRFHAYSHGRDAGEAQGVSVIVRLQGSVVPSGLFSTDAGFTKSVSTRPLALLPCSFVANGLSRNYRIKIWLQFRVGKQKKSVEKDFALEIHAPVLRDGVMMVEMGSLQVADEVWEQLPAYEAAAS